MKNTELIFRTKTILSLVLFLFLFTECTGQKSETSAQLEKGFLVPPATAKPRVWWHWMNGNISKDGIQKDLEWMNRSGIGGFQNFDAGMTTPQIVPTRLTYMTPEWKDAFLFTTKLADSLGLEMAIAGSPGWSESGGPWVESKDGMKKIVWSSVQATGGQTVSVQLPPLPSNLGVFQNLPFSEEISLAAETETPPEYTADIAVIAYKLPESHVSMKDLNPTITSSGGSFTLDQLTDGDLAKTSFLPINPNEDYSWIQFEFPGPQTIKSISIVGGADGGRLAGFFGGGGSSRFLESSNDGQNFTKVADLPAGAIEQLSINLEIAPAKYYRVRIKNPAPTPNLGIDLSSLGIDLNEPPPKGSEIAEIALYPYSIIDRFEEKAGYSAYRENTPMTTAKTEDAIPVSDVINISDKMNQDGTLNWTPPAGKWNIFRYGYSLTGKQNHPASPEATGLEVDKMDARAVTEYFENYLNQYKDATQGLMGARGLQYIITDSYEAGQENWTPEMANEFRQRRGYDMLPWLPVISGKIVKSAKESEKFLWDFRRTISELVAENHYDNLTTILDRYGMKRYTESHENSRAYIVDGMDVKRRAAIPMSACWVGGIGMMQGTTMHEADIRESASVAHIYGQNLVAAESLTAFGIMENAFSYHPGNLKSTADIELASGLNRFVIHTSVHQPVDDKMPGLGLGPFGQWFTRHETWADQAKVWTDYLSRSSFMLQHGKHLADIAYLYGQNNNITSLFGQKLPDIPKGYEYDFVNADVVMNVLTAKNGVLSTPSGMNYKVMVLDESTKTMTLDLLIKVSELVKAGAVICGSPVLASPALVDDPVEFARLTKEMWPIEKGIVKYGKGKVYSGYTIQEVLDFQKISPDFVYTKPNDDSELRFVHRKADNVDIYWVNNRKNRVENLEAIFRVSGKKAEIWHPETGKIEDATYSFKGETCTVPLRLEPNDAVFVVFRNKAEKDSYSAPELVESKLTAVDGSWDVSFVPKVGASFKSGFEALTPWNENTDNNIKYFSGSGTYSQTISVPAEWLSGQGSVCLDLGEVQNLAEVSVNGQSVGVVWKKPFRVDIGSALKEGENLLEIKVVNTWVNRLIGDAQPDVQQKLSYTTMPFYKATSRLQPSGLLGPVDLISIK